VQLAHLYGYRGEEDQAIVLYERAVRADPTQGSGRNQSWHVSDKKGARDRGHASLVRRPGAKPGLEIARMNLALGRRLAGDLQVRRAGV